MLNDTGKKEQVQTKEPRPSYSKNAKPEVMVKGNQPSRKRIMAIKSYPE